MTRLRESDYRKTLEVLYAAGEVDGPVAFTEPVLDALRELVPCDVAAFHEGSDRVDRALVYTGIPLGEMTADVRAARSALRDEDPLRRADGACRLSDVVAAREFRRREFYARVHRPLGVEHLMWVYIDPERTDARLELDRGEHDFDERDCRVLNLLVPHLRQLLRRAARRSLVAGRGESLTPREREVLEAVAQGRTNGEVGRLLDISPETVRKHLENAYEKLGVHTRTAAAAALRLSPC